MNPPKETIVDLQQAYEEAKLRVHDPEMYWRIQKYKERLAKGLCTVCGHKKLTKYQKKHKIISCVKCKEKRNQRKKMTKYEKLIEGVN